MERPPIRYVICRTTGTILDLHDCYIVTAQQLGDADTDSEVCDVADSVGVSVEQLLKRGQR